MVVIAVMVVVGIVAATVFVVWYLRSWGRSVSETEAELHEPYMHSISYDVPPGRDPADLAVILDRAGYKVIENGPGRLLIGCPKDADEAFVRRLLEHA